MQELIEEARADFPEPEPLPGQKITIDHPEQACLTYLCVGFIVYVGIDPGSGVCVSGIIDQDRGP